MLKDTLLNACDTIFNSSNDATSTSNSLGKLFNGLYTSSLPMPPEFSLIRVVGGDCVTPYGAALCMEQTERTIQFLRGLKSAIEHLRFTLKRKVNVLYAGSGPFATLALPMTSMFDPEEVNFSVIDIYEYSIRNVRHLVSLLEIEDYFKDYILGDATTYNPKNPPDILITETMNAGLLDEAQVAITAQLAKHLPVHGILIPEEVFLGIRLSRLYPPKKSDVESIDTGTFYSLSRNTQLVPPYVIKGVIPVPKKLKEGCIYGITLTTRLNIFGGHTLGPNSSEITDDIRLNPVVSGGQREIQIQYDSGSRKEDIKIEIT